MTVAPPATLELLDAPTPGEGTPTPGEGTPRPEPFKRGALAGLGDEAVALSAT